MRQSAIVPTSKAVIEFDSNDQIFAVRLLSFIGFKTATAVKAKSFSPFSPFRHKTRSRDEYKCENLRYSSFLELEQWLNCQ